MPTPPHCSVSIKLEALSRTGVAYTITTDVSGDFQERNQGGFKTHMLYEALEVQIGNVLRPAITKLLTQIKENYTY